MKGSTKTTLLYCCWCGPPVWESGCCPAYGIRADWLLLSTLFTNAGELFWTLPVSGVGFVLMIVKKFCFWDEKKNYGKENEWNATFKKKIKRILTKEWKHFRYTIFREIYLISWNLFLLLPIFRFLFHLCRFILNL